MTGRRNRRTGKPTGQMGARRKSEEERRALTPIYAAADEVRWIAEIFRANYEKRLAAKFRERATEIAEARSGIKYETLKQHIERARNAEGRRIRYDKGYEKSEQGAARRRRAAKKRAARRRPR